MESQEYGSKEMCECVQECMVEPRIRMFQWRPKEACMKEQTAVPTVLYGSEAWVLKNKIKNRMDVAEISCLRSMCGVTRRDRVRNEKIRRKCGLQKSLSERG